MENEYPDKYVCPITLNLMLEPVKAMDNKIYERKAIEDWFTKSDTSPLTSEKISDKLFDMLDLQNEIKIYIKKNNLIVERYSKFINKSSIQFTPITFVENSTSLIYFNCFDCNESLLFNRPNYVNSCSCGVQYIVKECVKCFNKFVTRAEISRNFKCSNCHNRSRISECIIC